MPLVAFTNGGWSAPDFRQIGVYRSERSGCLQRLRLLRGILNRAICSRNARICPRMVTFAMKGPHSSAMVRSFPDKSLRISDFGIPLHSRTSLHAVRRTHELWDYLESQRE
jgi:hypothetical protein